MIVSRKRYCCSTKKQPVDYRWPGGIKSEGVEGHPAGNSIFLAVMENNQTHYEACPEYSTV